MSGQRLFIEHIRWIGWRSAFAAGIAGLAVAGSAALATVALAARSSVAAPSARRGLDVLPFPGTPDAAPKTKIDFPAVSAAEVARVAAVGSRSGPHGGHLSAQPGDNGVAFTPDAPFTPGERVSVTASFRSPAAGTASGAPGQKRISFSFSVARPANYPSPNEASAEAVGPAGSRAQPGSHPATRTFVTEPGFKPPVVTLKGKGADAKAGDIFFDAQGSGQNAASILSPRGSIVWYQPSPGPGAGLVVHNPRVQRYQGHPVLTYWQGHSTQPPGGGRGVDLILNKHYQTIHTVTAGDGYQSRGADSHDFVLGHQGSESTAFIQIWSPVQTNLTSVGGPAHGPAYDWIIQEIDIATGKVIWEWHALGHIPLTYSYTAYSPAVRYDFFHLNSIQQLPDGNILISSRNTWAVYLIDKKTGKVLWTLGGKHSSFKMGPGTDFEWQHDATLRGKGLVTLFDDGGATQHSSALELQINTATHRARLIHRFSHLPPTHATSEGSTQRLLNRDVFVGWGTSRYFSEYTPGGRQILSGAFPRGVASERVYRFNDWIGSPLQPPAIAVRRGTTTGKDTVYASWNGSTQVRKWQVLTSASKSGPFVKLGPPAAWRTFETRIHTRSAGYFEVEALGARGHVLATSAAVPGP